MTRNSSLGRHLLLPQRQLREWKESSGANVPVFLAREEKDLEWDGKEEGKAVAALQKSLHNNGERQYRDVRTAPPKTTR